MCLLYMERKILYRFFEGKASLEEEKEVCDWTEASEENMQEYIKERKYFDLLLVQNKRNSTPAFFFRKSVPTEQSNQICSSCRPVHHMWLTSLPDNKNGDRPGNEHDHSANGTKS